MAALLVAMSVMAVLLGALLPQWTTLATREKEQELIFRGNQYARAIGLFQRKFANTAPPTIDLLVEQRFLRKKYKDPITNDDFQPIYANQAAQGVSAPSGAARPGEQATANLGTPARQGLQSGFNSTGATGAGGIIGVTSKSTESSLRIYNGRSKYNEWAFVYVQTAQRPQGSGQGPGPAGQAPGQQRPGPFGMPPGSFGNPGQRPGGQQGPFAPGGAQPNRPPVPMPPK
jgi:type II secretory pathway pseudopilin PulG